MGMKARRYRAFQALLLALTGFFLLERVWSGKILLYINQRYVLLVLLAAVGLIILAQVVLQERKKNAADERQPDEPGHAGHLSGANLAWLAIPLLVGVIIPARALGTSALAARGVEISSPFNLQGSTGATALERPAAQRTVLDWIRAFHAAADPAALNGEAVDVIGFVYHDPRLKTEQFLIGRYTVACCIADASAIGISVNWTAAADLQNNQWVRVQGKLSLGELDSRQVPVIDAAEVTLIPEPDLPYLFP
jgi:putative membrane protein